MVKGQGHQAALGGILWRGRFSNRLQPRPTAARLSGRFSEMLEALCILHELLNSLHANCPQMTLLPKPTDLNPLEISCLGSDACSFFESLSVAKTVSQLKVEPEKIWDNFP